MKLVGPETDFCSALAHHLQCDFVKMEKRVFPDGEINPRIEEAPKDVILVNTLSSRDFDPNKYLLEYIFSIKNLREQGSERIVLVMPYLPYSRQDAVFRKGESFTSKYVLEMLKNLTINDIFSVTFHLHRQRTASLVEGITLHDVSGIDALTNYFNPDLESPLFVAPDEEAEKWAQQMAEPFSGEVAVLKKKRNKTTGEVETSGKIPEKRNVIIVDDMISTGGTIQKAITICRLYHALTITVCAVHGIFSRSVEWDKDINIITTNTVENPYMKADVTPQIAEAVAQVI